MPVPSFRHRVLAFALALSATAARAASDDGTRPEAPKSPNSILDVRIPIPHEPDAAIRLANFSGPSTVRRTL
jgi:hypothetical protein